MPKTRTEQATEIELDLRNDLTALLAEIRAAGGDWQMPSRPDLDRLSEILPPARGNIFERTVRLIETLPEDEAETLIRGLAMIHALLGLTLDARRKHRHERFGIDVMMTTLHPARQRADQFLERLDVLVKRFCTTT